MAKTVDELQAELTAKVKELDDTKSQMAEVQGKLDKASTQNDFFDGKFKDMGNELGELRTKAAAQDATIAELTEKISGQAVGPKSPQSEPDPEPAPEPSIEQLASENDRIQTDATEDQQALLDVAFENADPDIQEAIKTNQPTLASEKARNQFLRQALPPEEETRGWRRDPKRTKSGDTTPDMEHRIADLFSNAKKGAFSPTGPDGGAHTTRSQARTKGGEFTRVARPEGHLRGNDYLGSLKRQRRSDSEA